MLASLTARKVNYKIVDFLLLRATLRLVVNGVGWIEGGLLATQPSCEVVTLERCGGEGGI